MELIILPGIIFIFVIGVFFISHQIIHKDAICRVLFNKVVGFLKNPNIVKRVKNERLKVLGKIHNHMDQIDILINELKKTEKYKKTGIFYPIDELINLQECFFELLQSVWKTKGHVEKNNRDRLCHYENLLARFTKSAKENL